jgi:acetyl-CoA C-acetyltransferase
MPAAPVDPRSPCLVGTARRTWHPGDEPAPEPLGMWTDVARAAVADARARVDLLGRVDDLGVVHCQSWAYDRPAERCAAGLGLGPGHRTESILAGTSPQRLLDRAAERMLAGESTVALVVGAEALHTRKQYARAGEAPPWSHQHPEPPVLPIDLDEWYLPTEIAHGVLPAWLTFSLLEQARWAARGGTAADRSELGEVLDRINTVAVANPGAWFRTRRTADELLTPGPGNRLIATPYTKHMTAFMDVDMAAASVLMTHAAADELGVPIDRRVYLRGWGFARDSIHLGARSDLTSSPAIRAATGEALGMAGLGVDDIGVFDLYSCFGSAVQFARDALGLAHDDARPISVTGGLAYHGGPSSNYMGHSISHLTDHLRAEPSAVGLVTGVGMHMTKHVAGVWSATPGPIVRGEPHDLEQSWFAAPASTGDVDVVADASGPAQVLAACVVDGGDSAADHAVAVCELPDGRRCYGRSDDGDVVEAVATGAWVKTSAVLEPTGRGTNDLRL